MDALTVRLSPDAGKALASLAKRFGMSRGGALSWVLTETAPPAIPKRGKGARSESVVLELTADARAILDRVTGASDASASVVVEAYLGREYR